MLCKHLKTLTSEMIHLAYEKQATRRKPIMESQVSKLVVMWLWVEPSDEGPHENILPIYK